MADFNNFLEPSVQRFASTMNNVAMWCEEVIDQDCELVPDLVQNGNLNSSIGSTFSAFTPVPPRYSYNQNFLPPRLTTKTGLYENDTQVIIPESTEYFNCPQPAHNSFSRIATLLTSLSSYAESVLSVSSKKSELKRSLISVDEYIPPKKNSKIEEIRHVANTDESDSEQILNFSQRVFYEDSIDMHLAFTDIFKFIDLVGKENALFLREMDSEEYIDSQINASREDLYIHVQNFRKYQIDKELPSYVQRLQTAINLLSKDNSLASARKYYRPSLRIIQDRAKVRIRELFTHLSDQASRKKITLKAPKGLNKWEHVQYKNSILYVRDCGSFPITGRLHLIVYLLRKIYGILELNTQYTTRSIYYQLKSLPHNKSFSQDQIRDAISIVSRLLNTPPWLLNVLNTSKGLVYGDLQFTIGSKKIDCNNSHHGTSIPMDLNDLQSVSSSAHFLLIVEKDSVFQKLLADNLPNKLSRKFIIVTGKGFADITTRRFLNIMWRLLSIPMFIVVDADAYGIEIMLGYKFGSKATAFLSEDLALPTLKWLGVLPSEMKKFGTKTLPLTENDRKKLEDMKKRPYFAEGANKRMLEEIDALIKKKRKCEIEGIFNSLHFFSESYLPNKLYQKDFV